MASHNTCTIRVFHVIVSSILYFYSMFYVMKLSFHWCSRLRTCSIGSGPPPKLAIALDWFRLSSASLTGSKLFHKVIFIVLCKSAL